MRSRRHPGLDEAAGAVARIVPERQLDGGAAEVAPVMAEGPDRGRAVVRLDGERVAVVDNHAPVRRHRVIAWVGQVAEGSVLEVRNRATRGHPRTDLDAVVLR